MIGHHDLLCLVQPGSPPANFVMRQPADAADCSSFFSLQLKISDRIRIAVSWALKIDAARWDPTAPFGLSSLLSHRMTLLVDKDAQQDGEKSCCAQPKPWVAHHIRRHLMSSGVCKGLFQVIVYSA